MPSSLPRRLLRAARTEALLSAWAMGLWTPPDRRVLDGVILPHYARDSVDGARRRILFVGVKAYNVKGHALFARHDYATLDPNPAFTPFGGGRHFSCPLEALGSHVAAASLDVVVANGVIGHGLDEPSAIERSLAACHDALVPGGELVLGINEDAFTAFDPASSPALGRFEAFPFSPLGAAVVVVPTPLRERTHTFRFYRRPLRG